MIRLLRRPAPVRRPPVNRWLPNHPAWTAPALHYHCTTCDVSGRGTHCWCCGKATA